MLPRKERRKLERRLIKAKEGGKMKVEIDIKEQEEKLKTEARSIGEQLGEVQNQIAQLQQKQQLLINEALKNQGALDLIKSLKPE